MLAISMASHSGRTLPALLLVFLLSCASADVALGQPLGLVHSDDGLDYLAAPMQVGHSLPDVNLHKASSLVVGAVVAALALLLIAIAIVFINLRKRWRVLLLGTIAVLLIMLEAWLEHYISYRYEEDGRAQVARRLSLVRANLETILNNNLSLIKGMGIAISANPTLSQEQFNHYAKETLRTETLLINLVAAPDLIVSFAYPEAHKRALDGLDYRTRPEQYGDIKRIQKMRRMIVAGPVNLVQGGQGFIGRAPIYYTDPGTGTEQFWGIISSVMELEAVYEAAGVLELAQQQQIAIRKHSAETGLQPVFFGDEKVFDGNPVITEMRIGAESWHLASSLKGEPHGLAMAINGLRLLFVLVTLVSILIMQIRQRQQRERQALMDALSYREGVLAQVGRIANVGGWEYKVGQGFLYWSPEVYRILNVAPNKGPLSRRELHSMIDPESR
ncbi:MAG: CHASE domain-containing protein, partial [Cellvibrionaceae bacterium]|nr:CHASE domain-containing protein [Cellvibrionaceae bacterium]